MLRGRLATQSSPRLRPARGTRPPSRRAGIRRASWSRHGGALGPAKFGGGGAGVVALFGEGGAEDLVADGGVVAVLEGGLEGFLNAAVLAAVEGEDGDAAAGAEAVGEGAEPGVEDFEFVVHSDAEGLEDAALGVLFALGVEKGGEGLVDGAGEGAGALELLFGEGGGEEGGAGFVGVVAEEGGELLLVEFGDEVGGGDALVGVHAHVQGAFLFEAEAAGRVVDLHGGDAEVGEDEIGAVGPADLAEDAGEGCKVGAFAAEGVVGEAEGAEAFPGFGEFEGILIEAEEGAAGLDGFEQFGGVSAVAEGAVHGAFAGLGGEDFEDFGHHDGDVLASGGFAAGEDLGDGFGVEIGVVLLVFVLEAPGVAALVADAALVGLGGVGIAHSSLYLALEPWAFPTG